MNLSLAVMPLMTVSSDLTFINFNSMISPSVILSSLTIFSLLSIDTSDIVFFLVSPVLLSIMVTTRSAFVNL